MALRRAESGLTETLRSWRHHTGMPTKLPLNLTALWRRCCLALVSAALIGAPVSTAFAQVARDSRATTSSLPSLGDESGMSIAAERRLGDRIAKDIYRDPEYVDDPVLTDYLQSIWAPLLSAARARGDVPTELSERFAWELMIARDKRVNAFALPGGYLGVNLGLLAVTERPEELASVLAHELSHVSQRHIARMVSKQERMAPWLMGAMILAALAASKNPEVASAAIAGGQAVAAQSQLNFSRDMEREADRVGFAVLSGAGFEPQGFVDMFDKLQQAARLNDDGSFPYLRSHPLSSERIADMRARLPLAVGSGTGPARQALPAMHKDAPAVELHALMASRARVLAESSSDRQRAWLQTGQVAGSGPGPLYAAALSAMRLGQRELALTLARRLSVMVAPRAQSMVNALSLEVLLSPARPGRSIEGEQPLLVGLRDQAFSSGSRAGLLLGAQAALVSGAAPTAATYLMEWVVQHPKDAQAWQMLARAQQAQGQILRAIRSEAESRTAQLDHAGAVDRYKAAQGLPAIQRAADPIELAIVDSRRREVEALLREEAKEE
jgi:beta-barrel assembly-enhancing protease